MCQPFSKVHTVLDKKETTTAQEVFSEAMKRASKLSESVNNVCLSI
jgi:hypothetical protein